MTEDALFPMEHTPLPEPEPGLSAQRRLTLRQADLIAKGQHPLLATRAARYGWRNTTATSVHPEAPTDCSPDAPRNRPFTCGSCRFRELVMWNSGTYPKCVFEVSAGQPLEGKSLDHTMRASHGAQTDVRAWWPACRDYQPGDQAMSDDAMRSLPDGT